MNNWPDWTDPLSTPALPRIGHGLVSGTTGHSPCAGLPPVGFPASPDLDIKPALAARIRFELPQVQIKSFEFAERPGDARGFLSAGGPRRAAAPRQPGIRPATSTRLQPPRDMVKLVDRLFCRLQPPLEHLFQSSTIEFPFSPFAHQYSGIAFLFLRHSAILADEMGLGKTMQTITTIRLLMRSGQLRRTLLVCPKPLVTNWVKEFQLWAPELPVCVVTGDSAKRGFYWKD